MLRDALTRSAAATESALTGWRLDRLRAALDRPLLTVAAGATRATALLWARLHERRGHPAWSMGTQELRHRPIPRGAAAVVLSGSGRHHDLLGAAAHLARHLDGPLHAVVCAEHTPLADEVREAGGDAVVLPPPPPAKGLVHLGASVPMLVAGAALWHPGPFHACFSQAHEATPPPTRPTAVVTLGVGLAAPAAEAFAVRVREAGLAPAWSSSLRDLAHGAFLALKPGTWVVAFTLGAQRAAVQAQLAGLASAHALTLCHEPTDDATGALGLFGQGLLTLDAALKAYGVAPTRADVPPWGAKLYRAVLD